MKAAVSAQRKCTVSGLAERETYMFVAHQSGATGISSFRNTATSSSRTGLSWKDNALRVKMHGNTGMQADIAIYSLSGELMYRSVETGSGEIHITPGSAKGVCIIKVNGFAQRIPASSW